MSAFGTKRDVPMRSIDVCFWGKADIPQGNRERKGLEYLLSGILGLDIGELDYLAPLLCFIGYELRDYRCLPNCS